MEPQQNQTQSQPITDRKYERWDQHEDALLRKGATMLPGRTIKAVYQRRRQLGLVKPAKWDANELKLAEQNIVPEGRTKAALRCIRNKLGFTNKVKVNEEGQMELNLTPASEHANIHIHTVVGNFVRTVDILRRGGMTTDEIAKQLNKPKSVIDKAVSLSESLRIK